jgi:NADH:ubiquinone oxidoreductase subunit F (NADH-binding)
VHGRPTLINNVETLAHLALIARFGAAWFSGLGTADNPGTALVTVTGDVARPGVYEIPFGVPVAELLSVAGEETPATAVLIGGYSGRWIGAAAAGALTLDSSSLGRVGASLGCGAITVLSAAAGSCGLREAARVSRWLAAQSAEQCGPCANGLPAVSAALDRLVAGDSDGRGAAQLRRWLPMIEGRGACHHPDGAVRFVGSTLTTFAEEIERHRRLGPCPATRRLLPTPALGGSWR